MRERLGKLLYGALFTVVLPVLLMLWAVRAESVVTLRSFHSIPIGVAVAGIGLVLMIQGMAALWKIGGGLPMNAYPPAKYVASGIYRVIYHPIYTGFVFVCGGCSVIAGSASGLWLTTPVVALGSAALVLGYELPDLRRRFGSALPALRFLPPDESASPSLVDRIRCWLTVLFPWLALYEAVVGLGIPRDAIVAYLPFENQWPVVQWSEMFYLSVYPVVVLAPLMVSKRSTLRRFSLQALASMVIVFPIFFTIPFISPPRPFMASSFWGHVLNLERTLDSAVAAFPSYHVIWAFLAAAALAEKAGWRKLLWYGWAFMVAVSCVMTGMHALIDVLTGSLLVAGVLRIEKLWSYLRDATEWLANSWREWRLGPVRIINHGAFAGAAAFAGILIIETCLVPDARAVPVAIFVFGISGAAIWAQWIEGSSILLRPLGFYGGLLGSILGAVLSAVWTHTNPWLALAALSVAAPWIQGIGRLRCLVQGCCHGRPTSALLGIRYSHPRSRVFRIEDLRGVPVHATPLYSILWNVLVALAVGRLYLLQANAAMVGGVYLILSGLGRFVEEAYRGEPQTPVVAGLRLYQWIAVATVVAGAVVTTFTHAPIPSPPRFDSSSLAVAFACGLAAWFVAGVDFPESNRRFARLT